MFKAFLIICLLFLSIGGFAQVKANDSLYQNFNHHNRVDSLYLYQSFKWKGNSFELVGIEKVEDFRFELSSKGGLLNISTPYSIEDFIYKGASEDFMAIRLDTGMVLHQEKIKAYLYEQSEKKIESFFYFFPDQSDRIYRIVRQKKRMDILLYFISPKD